MEGKLLRGAQGLDADFWGAIPLTPTAGEGGPEQVL